jgi:hypothetical protein
MGYPLRGVACSVEASPKPSFVPEADADSLQTIPLSDMILARSHDMQMVAERCKIKEQELRMLRVEMDVCISHARTTAEEQLRELRAQLEEEFHQERSRLQQELLAERENCRCLADEAAKRCADLSASMQQAVATEEENAERQLQAKEATFRAELMEQLHGCEAELAWQHKQHEEKSRAREERFREEQRQLAAALQKSLVQEQTLRDELAEATQEKEKLHESYTEAEMQAQAKEQQAEARQATPIRKASVESSLRQSRTETSQRSQSPNPLQSARLERSPSKTSDDLKLPNGPGARKTSPNLGASRPSTTSSTTASNTRLRSKSSAEVNRRPRKSVG